MNTKQITSLTAGAAFIVLLAAPSFSQTIPAFPGAEGFGKWATGGRGGEVIYVTNLNDTGEGSLRAALKASGPRTIVFRTGGLITLSSSLEINNPDVTIAGQTAPGDGICLRSSGTRGMNMVVVKTRNVIIRYLKFRRGPSTNGGECNGDNLTLINADKCIIDHCSFSWSTDEIVNGWPATNTTFQNCIFAEALHNSTHSDNCDPAGPFESHGLGPLMGAESKNITFYGNLFAHNTGRNPMFSPTDGGVFQLVNNVIYNVCYGVTLEGRNGSTIEANAIGNLIKWGPNSCSNHRNNIIVGGNASVYVEGNITPLRNADDPEWNATSEWMTRTPARTSYRSNTQFAAPPIEATSAFEAYSGVPETAGANKVAGSDGAFRFVRDTVDGRIYDDVRSGDSRTGTQGARLDDPSDAGGWPTYSPGTAYADADSDGMPDAWEATYHLDADNAADRNGDNDDDGYTNLEEFLNGTVPVASTEAPTVAFTQPTETIVTEPADLGVVAEATAPGGSIDSVKLYLNDTFVRRENNAPYEWGTANTTAADSALLGLTEGTYTLRVTATDANGTTASDTMEITVEPGVVGVRGEALSLSPVPADHALHVFDLRGRHVVRVVVLNTRRVNSRTTGSGTRGVFIVKSHCNDAPSTRLVILDETK